MEPWATVDGADEEDLEYDDELDDDEVEFTPRQLAEMVLPTGMQGPPLPPGEPEYYECLCPPAGKFAVHYDRGAAPGARWQLSIDRLALGTYPDHLAAMLAVCHFETGYEKWDNLKGEVKPPTDSSHWESWNFNPGW